VTAEGVLLVDKPRNVTSHDVVDTVRRTLGTKKVGHAGTLDPMATGLLIVGVGRATRLLRFLSRLPKTYTGSARLGVETTTLDTEGEVVREETVSVNRETVRDAMRAFVGDAMQRPPAFSAVKVGGRKLYEAARKGESLDAPARPVRVDRFELVAFEPPGLDFAVTCSAGTYVRVLVADLGTALGCGAHLTRLRRVAIGPFEIGEAVPPVRVGQPLPVERAVVHLPAVRLHPEEAVAASHGRPLGPAGIGGPYAVFDPEGRLIGVYEDEGPLAKPQVILAHAAEPEDRAR